MRFDEILDLTADVFSLYSTILGIYLRVSLFGRVMHDPVLPRPLHGC